MSAADMLAGLPVQLPDRCRCGSNVAIIGDGDATHRASLLCRSCERRRGWLSTFTASWIESVISKFGKPEEAIVFQGPRL